MNKTDPAFKEDSSEGHVIRRARKKAAARERARKVLDEFLGFADELIPGIVPFPVGLMTEEEEQEMLRDLHPTPIDPKLTKFVLACGEILSAAIPRKIHINKGEETVWRNPSKAALDEFFRALSRKVEPLEGEWRYVEFEIKLPPWTRKPDPIRQAAETLQEYLDLIEWCGPVHTACKLDGCHAIVFGGRGNKVFCSDEHREEYWSYRRMKAYYDNKQKKNRLIRKHTQRRKASHG